MTNARKLLISLLVVGGVATVAGYGTFSAFSSTTSNGSNSFSAGTVIVADNDGGSSVMWNVSGQKPNDTVSGCIQVQYTGSLPATIKLYTGASGGGLGPYLNMTIDKGTGSSTFNNCSGFSSQTQIYNGTLSNFSTTYTTFANGISAYPGAQTAWNNGDVLVYKFVVTLANNNAAQGLSSTITFTWEAQNQ